MMHSCASGCQHPLVNPKVKQSQLAIALTLVSGFALLEMLIGFTSGSLSLVAEAAHMTSDCFALGLALVTSWLSEPVRNNPLSDSLSAIAPRQQWETWAALINGIGLLLLTIWIGWEAVERLRAPSTEIASLPMLITAAIGLVVNLINIRILHQGSDHDLNLRAALLHVTADAISSVGILLAAIAVATKGYFWADGVISLFVAVLILISAFPLVLQSIRQLQELRAIDQANLNQLNN